MSIIQGIIASISAGVATPAYVPSVWTFSGDDAFRTVTGGDAGTPNNWLSDISGWLTNGSVSNPAPAWNTITYANGTTGHTYDFTGTEYLYSPILTGALDAWTSGDIAVGMWFYPTANNIQVLAETNNIDLVSGYHCSILEIDSSNKMVGRFWPFGSDPSKPPAIISTDSVNLNAWNYVHLRSIGGSLYMGLNGVSQGYGSGLAAYAGPGPTSTRFAIGPGDTTSVSNSNPFQGKIGQIRISDTDIGDWYATERSKYIPTPKTFESGIPPAAGTNANWSGATIVGSHTVWPPGTPGSQTGVIISSGTYIDVPVTLNKDSCTVEIVAELFPTQFWATMWGNDSWTAGQGYAAYFNGASTLNTGSPTGTASLNLNTIAIGDRAHWVFTFSGSTVVVYRNGTALTTQSFTAPTSVPFNDMYIGARHNNDGVGPTDFCPGTYYYFKVSDTVLDGTAVTAKYDSIKGNYGLP
jgi:hypothetical protein